MSLPSDFRFQKEDTLSRDEYIAILDKLARKQEDKTVMMSDRSIELIGVVGRMWQSIKGWLGFNNQADPVKVSYQLLKLLRDGEKHQYFKEPQIQQLLHNVQQALDKDKFKRYEEVVNVIGVSILNETPSSYPLKKRIIDFQTHHQRDLHENFWPKLFHRYITPLPRDIASVQFQKGRIKAEEGLFEEAIAHLEAAVKVVPDNLEWRLALCESCYYHAKNLGEQEKLVESDTFLQKALKHIQSIDQDDLVTPLLSEHFVRTTSAIYTLRFAQLIKSNLFEIAIQTAREGAQTLNREMNDLLEIYESEYMTQTATLPTNTQLGEFYFLLAQDEKDPIQKNPLFDKAISVLTAEATREGINPPIIQKLIQAHIERGKSLLNTERQSSVEDLVTAHTLFKDNQQFFPGFFSKPLAKGLADFSQDIVVMCSTFDEHDLILQAKKVLKALSEGIPVEQAFHCFEISTLYMKRDLLNEALKSAEEALKLNPTNPDYSARVKTLLSILGSKAYETFRNKDAIKFFGRAVELDPSERTTHFRLVTALTKEKQWESAERSCRILVRNHPKDAEARTLFSKILAQQEIRSEAIAQAREAVRLNPNDPNALKQLLDVAGAVEGVDVNQAVETYKRMLTIHPQDWRIHTHLGLLYLQQHDYKQAIRFFETAIKLNETSPEPVAALGKLFLEQEKFSEAQAFYEKAAELALLAEEPLLFQEELYTCRMKSAEKAITDLDYAHVLPNYERAMEYLPSKEGEVVRAIINFGDSVCEKNAVLACEAYKKVLHLLTPELVDPEEWASIYLTLGQEARDRKAFEEAIKYLQFAEQKSPTNLKILTALKICYVGIQDQKSAERLLLQMIESGNSTFKTHEELGVIYRTQHDYEKALNHYKLAKNLSGSDTYNEGIQLCLMELAKNCALSSQYKLVIDYLKEALATSTNKLNEIVSYLVQLGISITDSETLFAIEMFELAASHFKETSLPEQMQFEILHRLAAEAQKREDYTQASRYYERCLEISPNDLEIIKNLILYNQQNHNLSTLEAYLKRAIVCDPVNSEWPKMLGRLYQEKNLPELATEMFQKAATIEHKNKGILFQAEIEAGNAYLQKSTGDTQRVLQSVIGFTNYVLTSPYNTEITQALGAVFGKKSTENQLLIGCAQPLTKIEAQEVYRRGMLAITLVKRAYDNKTFHLAKELPIELSKRVSELERQLQSMLSYFNKVQELTEELVDAARTAGFQEVFSTWKTVAEVEDMSKIDLIERRAQSALGLTTVAMDSSESEIDQELKDAVEALRRCLSPYSWTELAILHYLKAKETVPDEYGDHCNGLIEAYTLIGNEKNALRSYIDFENRFPNHPLRIQPEVFVHVIEEFLTNNDPDTALKMITKAISKFPTSEVLKRAQSRVYATMGDNLQKQGNDEEAIKCYENAIACCANPEASCYFKTSELYNKALHLHYDQLKILPENQIDQFKNKCIQYRIAAANSDPQNAMYQFECGKSLMRELETPFHIDPLPYLTKAVALDNKNHLYAYGLLMLLQRRKEEGMATEEDFMAAFTHFKEIGGNIHDVDEQWIQK